MPDLLAKWDGTIVKSTALDRHVQKPTTVVHNDNRCDPTGAHRVGRYNTPRFEMLGGAQWPHAGSKRIASALPRPALIWHFCAVLAPGATYFQHAISFDGDCRFQLSNALSASPFACDHAPLCLMALLVTILGREMAP